MANAFLCTHDVFTASRRRGTACVEFRVPRFHDERSNPTDNGTIKDPNERTAGAKLMTGAQESCVHTLVRETDEGRGRSNQGRSVDEDRRAAYKSEFRMLRRSSNGGPSSQPHQRAGQLYCGGARRHLCIPSRLAGELNSTQVLITRGFPSTQLSSGRRPAWSPPSATPRRKSGPTPPSRDRRFPSRAGACRRGRTSGHLCSWRIA